MASAQLRNALEQSAVDLESEAVYDITRTFLPAFHLHGIIDYDDLAFLRNTLSRQKRLQALFNSILPKKEPRLIASILHILRERGVDDAAQILARNLDTVPEIKLLTQKDLKTAV